jgi:uncharacterized membrane-anchored protein
MTQQHRLKLAAVMLFLPLLLLGGIILKNERDIASAKTWRVKITGYDPRDLLYGHYLSFRFDWGLSSEHGLCLAGQSCCLCLDAQQGSTAPLTSLKSCEAAAQCATALSLPNRSGCTNGAQGCPNDADAFDPEGVQRYFVPESAATQLNMLLTNRQFNLSVDLNIAPAGRHILGGLYIDNIEWRDYLRQHPDAGRPEPTQSQEEHRWRMKITDARLYGAYLVFRLDWGAPLTPSACPNENSCCALCLSEQPGSSQPAVRYKTCGEREQCLESLTLPDTNRLKHADSGFDPNGAQRYPMSTDEAEQLAHLLAGPPKNMSIDVTTRGGGGPPDFGDIYIDGAEWHDWRRQHPGDRKPAGAPRGKKR